MVNRTIALWLAVGWAGFAILPWYGIEYGFWNFEWLFEGYPLDGDSAPGLLQIFLGGKPWLAPLSLALLAPLLVLRKLKNDPLFARVLLVAGGGGLARSEEHTSELQSLMRTSYAVFCLKKNKQQK